MEIKIENLSRTYSQGNVAVEAVKNVSLVIPSNVIYGIIGNVFLLVIVSYYILI